MSRELHRVRHPRWGEGACGLVDRRHQVAVVYFFAAFQVVVVSLAELVRCEPGGSGG